MPFPSRGRTVVWWVLVGAASTTVAAVGIPFEAVVHGVPVVWAFAFVLMQSAAIVLSPFRPIASIALFSLGAGAVALWRPPAEVPWPWSVTAIVAFAFVAGLVTLSSGWRTGAWAFVVPAAVVSVHVVRQAPPDASIANVAVALSVGLAVTALAALLGERRDLGSALRREREVSELEHAGRLRAEERQRIARELHDVVAHGLSLIQVQASTARYRLPGIDERTAAEFGDIGASARRSLGEMRGLLGVLRTGDDAPLVPVEGIDGVDRLVDDAAEAGANVSLVRDVFDVDLPSTVHLAAYRIVQESISNALRHAPGSPVEVRVVHEDDALRVTVANGPSAEHVEPLEGAGLGLLGMRERAAIAGGTVRAETTPDGGYVVDAVLPVGADDEEGRP